MVECGLDVSRIAFHLRMVDRFVGSARVENLGRRLDRVLFLHCGWDLFAGTPRFAAHPRKGDFDLQAFHREEGRKYLVAYAILSWVTVAANAALGEVNGILQWSVQNIVIVPMAVVTSVAAIFIKQAWIQRLALTIQIVGWILYFAFFQSALSE